MVPRYKNEHSHPNLYVQHRYGADERARSVYNVIGKAQDTAGNGKRTTHSINGHAQECIWG